VKIAYQGKQNLLINKEPLHQPARIISFIY